MRIAKIEAAVIEVDYDRTVVEVSTDDGRVG